jgi:hypothetical protein
MARREDLDITKLRVHEIYIDGVLMNNSTVLSTAQLGTIVGTSQIPGLVTSQLGPYLSTTDIQSLVVTDLGLYTPLYALQAVDVTCTSTLLATAGKVNVITAPAGAQYKIRGVNLVGGGTNFAGTNGDRLLSLTDGTTIWTTIPATNLQTAPATTVPWGNAAAPFLTGTSITSSAVGANIYFQYSGGTTDYTSGSIKFSVIFQRVA